MHLPGGTACRSTLFKIAICGGARRSTTAERRFDKVARKLVYHVASTSLSERSQKLHAHCQPVACARARRLRRPLPTKWRSGVVRSELAEMRTLKFDVFTDGEARRLTSSLSKIPGHHLRSRSALVDDYNNNAN